MRMNPNVGNPPGLRPRKKTAAERRQQRMRSEARMIQRMLKSFYLLGHHRGSQLSMLGRAMERALLEAAADPAVGQSSQIGVVSSQPPGAWIHNGMLWANPVAEPQATMEHRPTMEDATGGNDVVESDPIDRGPAENEETLLGIQTEDRETPRVPIESRDTPKRPPRE